MSCSSRHACSNEAHSQLVEQPVLKRPAAATVPANDKAADPIAPLPGNKEELKKADWNTSTALTSGFVTHSKLKVI